MFKIFSIKKYNSGVTLVELIVVIFIFVLMSGVILFNYDKFRSQTSLQNLADDIALSVRKAQSYAIGVRGTNTSFEYSYGIHFTANASSDLYEGSNKSFILFTNIADNKQYDYNGAEICGSPTLTNECLEMFSINSTDLISEIYINDEVNPKLNLGIEGTLDIFFKRPNPEPEFCINLGSGCTNDNISYVRIRISNVSDPNSFKEVIIWNNGQISVS